MSPAVSVSPGRRADAYSLKTERENGMKTRNSFSISFFIKKDKASRGTAPLYVRITVNGNFADLTLKRRVQISSWNQEAQRVIGNGQEEKSIKEKIRLVRNEKRPNDIYLSQLDYRFISDLEIYLWQRRLDKGQRPCSNNAVMKHMERLNKIIGLALKNDWIAKNPFKRFERNMIHKDRDCLEFEEIELIKNLQLEKEGQDIIRDMFLFSCYTDLHMWTYAA